jgi:hypothetical protein
MVNTITAAVEPPPVLLPTTTAAAVAALLPDDRESVYFPQRRPVSIEEDDLRARGLSS